jgi:hypothetical protein
VPPRIAGDSAVNAVLAIVEELTLNARTDPRLVREPCLINLLLENLFLNMVLVFDFIKFKKVSRELKELFNIWYDFSRTQR